ncbi:GerAB/ArcD/ProY family transporter [Heyndrickxia sp. NPDC080065]|uniref:GerAB/ArcD/ProY family transporter n=1 Tax=Heyndrickxia sp. NPDC080065 TaxID=3390568 RepID=UPI003CFF55D9
MEKGKINAYQLFVLVFLFEHGSSLVIALGTEAKQDAWVSILFGMFSGLFLYAIYYRLFRFYPEIPLTSYVQKIIGPFLGKIIAFIYLLYFFYIGALVLRDFGELLLTFAYPNTPMFIINSMMILAIMYAIHKGIEVLARTGEIFFILLYFLAFSGFILIVASGLIDLSKLKPVLEEGLGHILHATITETIYFPFGETIVFTMILPYLNIPSKAKFAVISAMVLSGINLTITSAVNIAVLGVDLVSRSAFPLLSTIQKIEVANFLERLDVFFMFATIIGCFFKIAIFFYAAVIGTSDLFKLKNHLKLVYPLGLVILFFSISIASNIAEHIKKGTSFIPIYIHIPMQVVIPLFLLMIVFIRNRKNKAEKNNNTSG